jgi:hypothetical protein
MAASKKTSDFPHSIIITIVAVKPFSFMIPTFPLQAKPPRDGICRKFLACTEKPPRPTGRK